MGPPLRSVLALKRWLEPMKSSRVVAFGRHRGGGVCGREAPAAVTPPGRRGWGRVSRRRRPTVPPPWHGKGAAGCFLKARFNKGGFEESVRAVLPATDLPGADGWSRDSLLLRGEGSAWVRPQSRRWRRRRRCVAGGGAIATATRGSGPPGPPGGCSVPHSPPPTAAADGPDPGACPRERGFSLYRFWAENSSKRRLYK